MTEWRNKWIKKEATKRSIKSLIVVRTVLRLLVIFLHHVVAPVLCPPVSCMSIWRKTQHKWVNNMAVCCVSCLNIFVHYYFVHFFLYVDILLLLLPVQNLFFREYIINACFLILFEWNWYFQHIWNLKQEKKQSKTAKRLFFCCCGTHLTERSLFILIYIPIYKTKILMDKTNVALNSSLLHIRDDAYRSPIIFLCALCFYYLMNGVKVSR